MFDAPRNRVQPHAGPHHRSDVIFTSSEETHSEESVSELEEA